jgi:pyruvate dehydrogenase E2 component (dihydrolipoamide acetyltransferase)
MSGTLTVEVPDIGDFEEVPIIEILVSAGDTVAPEDPLVTLESDKATMDVPSPSAGVIKEIVVSLGDRVSQGSPLMTLEGESDGAVDAHGAAPEAQQAVETAAQAEAPPPESAPAPSESSPAGTSEAPPQELEGNGRARGIYASPSARRLARELGVELRRVSGSGRNGRITKDDVQAAARAPAAAPSAAAPGLELPPWPKVEFEKFGPVERVERSRIQRISAPNLARNWVMIPHVTHNDEADITELEAWRKQLNSEQLDDAGAARSGSRTTRARPEQARQDAERAASSSGSRAGGKPAKAKVTMVSFLVLASVAALKEFPTFNSSLDGEQLVLKRYYNIGFAADTPGGLVVPVIKDADRKGLLEVAGELSTLSAKARDGKLSPADMSGSTFTISSLGGIGGTSFTPIVNAPEVAILGVTRSAMKPVWDGSVFVPRLMVPLSLSYDHRVIDGAAAARFVAYLVKLLSDLRRALL